MRTSPPNTGFTLIEISIVIVVIALTIGGVLVGRDLIRAAEIRAFYGEVEQFRAAVQAFKNKYDSLPGDFENATDFFGTHPKGCGFPINRAPRIETCNGNGNNYIGDGYEEYYFWQHLTSAKLIPGMYNGATNGHNRPAVNGDDTFVWEVAEESLNYDPGGPEMIAVGVTVIDNEIERNHIFYTVDLLNTDPGYSTQSRSIMTPKEAWQFDKKYDDGLPISGTIRILYASAGSGLPDNCTSSSEYDVGGTTEKACLFAFDVGL